MKKFQDVLVDILKTYKEDQIELTKESVNEYFKNKEELLNKCLEKMSKDYFS